MDLKKYIKDKYNYTQSEMLGLLDFGKRIDCFLDKREMFNNLLLERQFLLELKESKVGLISDTHIGNEKDNFNYIKLSYNQFDEENIETVFNLGDFFDAFNQQNVYTQQEINAICTKQIQRAYDLYPKNKKTYIIFGNHDELFRKAGIENIDIRLYRDLRHDILHEECRRKIYNDIYRWLRKCIEL